MFRRLRVWKILFYKLAPYGQFDSYDAIVAVLNAMLVVPAKAHGNHNH